MARPLANASWSRNRYSWTSERTHSSLIRAVSGSGVNDVPTPGPSHYLRGKPMPAALVYRVQCQTHVCRHLGPIHDLPDGTVQGRLTEVVG